MTPTRARRTTVAATLAVTLLASVLLASPSAAKGKQRTMVVIGDSITWRYNNVHGSASRGWWSYLGSKLHLKVVRHAERGSGYGRRGKKSDGSNSCKGTTFAARLTKKKVRRDIKAARVVILAGGVNDYRRCRWDPTEKRWRLAPSNPATIERQITLTMTRLAALRRRPTSVFVTAPWGSGKGVAADKEWITQLIEAEAKRHGFRYVDTAHGTLNGKRTNDGVHPNAAGNLRLYRDIYRHSDIARWGKPLPKKK